MKMGEISDFRVISLFEDMTDSELGRVIGTCNTRRYEKHAQIAAEGDHSTDIFFILAGNVRVNSITRSGREVIFSDLTVGDLFGEFAAVDHQPRSATLVALSNCLLARMTAESFFDLLHENSSVAVHLIRLLVAKNRRTSERMFEMSALGLRERLRRELLRLAGQGTRSGHSVVIHPAPTHQDLAALIGSHREAVTKELNRLEHAKIVDVKRGEIRILDLRALERDGRVAEAGDDRD
jgi:CRP/FNR family transcriptional regulator, cyclic AMP receptor protein